MVNMAPTMNWCLDPAIGHFATYEADYASTALEASLLASITPRVPDSP